MALLGTFSSLQDVLAAMQWVRDLGTGPVQWLEAKEGQRPSRQQEERPWNKLQSLW